jgi:hypothetical protein
MIGDASAEVRATCRRAIAMSPTASDIRGVAPTALAGRRSWGMLESGGGRVRAGAAEFISSEMYGGRGTTRLPVHMTSRRHRQRPAPDRWRKGNRSMDSWATSAFLGAWGERAGAALSDLVVPITRDVASRHDRLRGKPATRG